MVHKIWLIALICFFVFELKTDERIAKIREGYLKMLEEYGKAKEIKTVKFPEPLSKFT